MEEAAMVYGLLSLDVARCTRRFEDTNLSGNTRQGSATNVGYLLFAFGAMWVAGIAVVLAGGRSMPNCEYTVLGDSAVCSQAVTLASEAMQDHPSLASFPVHISRAIARILDPH